VELTHDMAAQHRYARWLAVGTCIGLALLVAAFVGYLFGAAPHVPIDKLPTLWRGSAADLLAATGLRSGWGWAGLLHRSDMLVLAAIALLTSCSIACLAAVIPIFRSRGETAFVVICILQILVLVLAASGVLATGH
jgi:hypothetical protein